jgi:hypothetical protein
MVKPRGGEGSRKWDNGTIPPLALPIVKYICQGLRKSGLDLYKRGALLNSK